MTTPNARWSEGKRATWLACATAGGVVLLAACASAPEGAAGKEAVAPAAPGAPPAALSTSAAASSAPSPPEAPKPLAAVAESSVFKSVPALPADEADATFRDVRFRDGKTLPEVRIHYATSGTPKRDDKGAITNAVALMHWTGSNGTVLRSKAFVDTLFAPGKPLDASKYFLIFVDDVGHGKSSKPSDGLRAQFPNYGYADIVELQHHVIHDTLGIQRLHAIVGISMGGMNAWQWAEQYPDEVEGIMPIVANPVRVAGRNLLWRRWVSHQIRNDIEWKNGNYDSAPRGWTESFPIFRMLLDGVPHLQATIPDVSAADGFVREASAQAASLDANDILYSLEASTDYDPESKLESVRAKVFALNFSDDEFNPVSLHLLERLMKRVKNGRFSIQDGSEHSFGHFTQGHPELWAPRVSTFLSYLEDGKGVTKGNKGP